jgi:hypothetical protein
MNATVIPILPGGARACKHCGQAARDHALAMTEQRCRTVPNKRFEPVALKPRNGQHQRISNSFDDEEIEAMKLLFATLHRGGDVKVMLRRGALISVVQKFQAMSERLAK